MKMFRMACRLQGSVALKFKIQIKLRRRCFSRENCAAGRHCERMDRKGSTEETVRTRTTYAGAAQSLHEAKAEKVQQRGKKIEGEETTHSKI